MNPLAIVLTAGAAGIVAIVGYFAYQAFNANEPHKSSHTRPRNYTAAQSEPNSCYVGECTICLKRIELPQRKTLSCNHMFHRVCINGWKANRENAALNCPNCSICTICLEQIITSREILKCKHVFHKECIKKWLKIERTCPNCKKFV